MEWSACTERAVLSIQRDYVGGRFAADCTLPPIDGSDNGFDATNARLYIGEDWNAVFDDFQVHVDVDFEPVVSCVESYNPSTKNVPKASNTNQDGFYKVSASDICTTPVIKIGNFVVANGEAIKPT